jgi:boron transporter
MTGPLLIVLHLIPTGVLAGLFFVMGIQALQGNSITLRLLYLFRDPELHDKDDPLRKLKRQSAVWVFIIIQLLGFAATFAITQTIAAIGFPVIILLLIPFRTFAMPYWFTDEELRTLDAPTAGEFVMSSVGGSFGYDNSDDTTPVAEMEDEGGITHDANEHRNIEDGMERGESHELRARTSR